MDFNHLISLNVELEGLLKVLAERDSLHARSLLAEKFKEYSELLNSYLEGKADGADVAAAAEDLAESATHTEVKDQEAEEAELDDSLEDRAERGVADLEDSLELRVEREEADDDSASEAEAEAFATPTAPAAPVAPVTPAAPAYKAPAAPAAKGRLPKVFTLNDKFRFIREVFGGNESDFNDTVALLADMDSYEEASDYIANDMMLDTENPAVADFLAIVRQYLPAR